MEILIWKKSRFVTIKVALAKQQFVEVDDEAGNTSGKFMISNR